jgi:type II secretory pathway pseudopilin PulG
MTSDKGFTLIELIITTATLVIGIIGILSLFPVSVRTAKSAEMSTIAIQLAQGKIEEMISKSYTEIASFAETYGEIPDFEAFKRVTTVNYYDPSNSTTTEDDLGIKRVAVNVYWKSNIGINEKSVALVTLIVKK